jgi:thioredoxin-related protein
MRFLSPLAAVVLCLSPLAAQDESHATWYPDFDAAAKAAREAKKNLLVDFTGSDWCTWCIRLHDEVFEREEFLKPIGEHYLLVALDFPQGDEIKAKVPNPKRNEELSQKYGIQVFPTILLMTPDGEVFGRTGYQAGGPAKYVELLNGIAKNGKESLAKAKELETRFHAAEGDAREALLREAIELLGKAQAETIGVEVFERVTRAAFELDKDNAKGLKLAAVGALLAAGKVDEELSAMATELDPKNEHGIYEKLVLTRVKLLTQVEKLPEVLASIDTLDALGIKSEEVQRLLYANAAIWNQRFTKDMEKAKKYAQKALALGLDENPPLKQALEQIVNG